MELKGRSYQAPSYGGKRPSYQALGIIQQYDTWPALTFKSLPFQFVFSPKPVATIRPLLYLALLSMVGSTTSKVKLLYQRVIRTVGGSIRHILPLLEACLFHLYILPTWGQWEAGDDGNATTGCYRILSPRLKQRKCFTIVPASWNMFEFQSF